MRIFTFDIAAAQSVQKRRSSTRSIKRKKFDDELVESSLLIKQAEKSQKTFKVFYSSALRCSLNNQSEK